MPPARRLWSSICLIVIFTLLFNIYLPEACAYRCAENNILIFWTERDRLKAVTLMCLQDPHRPVGIVAIPTYIKINDDGRSLTISEAYGRLGRQGLTARLEELFKIPIGSYLSVDQSTLEKASSMIGPVKMEGKETSMAAIFEGTYTSGEIEPQSEIRSLAACLVEPRMMARAPHLLWIFSTEVNTNLGYKSFWSIYRAVERQGPDILNKKALIGKDYSFDRKHQEIPPERWAGVLMEVTGV